MMHRPENFKIKIALVCLLVIVAWLMAGCNDFEREMIIKKQQVEKYPFTICDKSESLLICDSAELTNCWGYLEEEPIITLEEKHEI